MRRTKTIHHPSPGAASTVPTTFQRDRELKWLPVEKIVPNERNPRSAPHFKLEQLQDLIASIKTHGILEPLIVQPYEQGLYLLLEGERRWTVAKHLKLKEVPTTIVRRLESDDQVKVMYNLHENRRGWEMADHLRAIKQLQGTNPDWDEQQLARELGISLATLRDRLRVLGMGDTVVNKIAQGKVDYTSALRIAQSATAIEKKRPELAQELGGAKQIEKKLIQKAEKRGGLSHELTSGKQDLTDRKHVPDEVIKEYVLQPNAGLRELRQQYAPAQAQRASVRSLAKSVIKIEHDLRDLQGADLSEAPNLMALQHALNGLIAVASALNARVSEVIAEKGLSATSEPVRLRRSGSALPEMDEQARLREEGRAAEREEERVGA